MRTLLQDQQMHYDFMYGILLHSFHQHVSATHVEWFRNILIISKFFIHQLMHKRIVFKTIHLCISWWIKNFDNIKMHGVCVNILIIFVFSSQRPEDGHKSGRNKLVAPVQ
jgi:hypothetical protein